MMSELNLKAVVERLTGSVSLPKSMSVEAVELANLRHVKVQGEEEVNTLSCVVDMPGRGYMTNVHTEREEENVLRLVERQDKTRGQETGVASESSSYEGLPGLPDPQGPPGRSFEPALSGRPGLDGFPGPKGEPGYCKISADKWDRRHLFDFRGGCLAKDDSDVKLFVPEGAIKPRTTVIISGKVYTNVNHYVERFKLAKHEVFASPVVEFSANTSTPFEKYLTLMIPVASSRCQNASAFRVLCLSNDGRVREVPQYHHPARIKNGMGYVLDDDSFVLIYTTHFSLFSAKSSVSIPKQLDGLVFGSCTPSSKQTPSARVRLYICDDLHLIKDFRKPLEFREGKFGRLLVEDRRILLLPNSKEDDTLAFSLKHEKLWKHEREPGNKQSIVNDQVLSLSMVCGSMQAQRPPLVAEWILNSVDNQDLFRCWIVVDHHSLKTKTCRKPEPIEQRTTLRIEMKNDKGKSSDHLSRDAQSFPRYDSFSNLEDIRSKKDFRQSAMDAHYRLSSEIHKILNPGQAGFQSVKQNLRSNIPEGDLAACGNIMDIFNNLYNQRKIEVGNYELIKDVFQAVERQDIVSLISGAEWYIQKIFDMEREISPEDLACKVPV